MVFPFLFAAYVCTHVRSWPTVTLLRAGHGSSKRHLDCRLLVVCLFCFVGLLACLLVCWFACLLFVFVVLFVCLLVVCLLCVDCFLCFACCLFVCTFVCCFDN